VHCVRSAKKMKLSVLFVLAVLVTACEPKKPVASDGHSTVLPNSLAIEDTVIVNSSPSDIPPGWNETGFCIGVARFAADHSRKANGPSVLIGDVAYLFRGDYQNFEGDDIGKKIRVTGAMEEGRLAMFILSPDHEGVVRSGIPMPPGTDIEKESRYYFIKNPKWEIVSEAAEQDITPDR
jgi:hypothetical protein